MKLRMRNFSLFLLSIIVVPAGLSAADIEVTGNTLACPVGNCGSDLQTSALIAGQSIPNTPFSFSYTASSGDQFQISGNYSAGFPATSGPLSLGTNFFVTYTGSAPAAGDTFTVNLLQDFNGGGPGNWNSPPNYTEHVDATVGNFTTFTANDCFDSNTACVGSVGPLGPGTYYDNVTSALTGLNGQYLAEDFEFTFNFAAGAPGGTTDTVLPNAPEPVQTIPVALGLLGFGSAWFIRNRRAKAQSC